MCVVGLLLIEFIVVGAVIVLCCVCWSLLDEFSRMWLVVVCRC